MKKIPNQLIRLIVPFAILIPGLIIAKWFVTPDTFGKYGHYRAAAIGDVEKQEMQYAGQQVCIECHDDILDKKQKSYHKGVSCEVCHGPALAHAEAPDEHLPPAPRDRAFCTLCHDYNAARPTGFPQIVPLTHNPGKACISCHDSHDPSPQRVPGDCGACHGSIARTKKVSPHMKVSCTKCHITPLAHKVNPRAVLPSKPTDRQFCGECHDQGKARSKKIPSVNISTHGNGYVCWECHYPHLPKVYRGEAK